MKKFVLFISLAVFLSSCGEAKFADNYQRKAKPTLTHEAYYWHGLNEQKDRQLLNDILGVDPVRTEWCAAFVNMVLLDNELPTSASVSKYPLTARSFLQWGYKVEEPRKGDVVVFTRGESWQGHVGFYVSSVDVNGVEYYHILGGNQSNSVNIESYAASRVVGIRRIDFGAPSGTRTRKP